MKIFWECVTIFWKCSNLNIIIFPWILFFFILRSWNEVNEIYFKYSSLWYIRWKSQDYFMKIDLALQATFMDDLLFRWNRRIKIHLKAKYCVRYFKIKISQKMYYFKMDFLKKIYYIKSCIPIENMINL